MPKLKTNIEKLFYPIGEVAQMYNVNVSLISKYVLEGLWNAFKYIGLDVVFP